VSHTIISRVPRPRKELNLIAAIALAEDVEDVDALLSQAGFESYEEFWKACNGEYAAQ
jgi:hypothetical protein